MGSSRLDGVVASRSGIQREWHLLCWLALQSRSLAFLPTSTCLIPLSAETTDSPWRVPRTGDSLIIIHNRGARCRRTTHSVAG